MEQTTPKAQWNHNLKGYNPSGLTPNKTLLEHIQDLEAEVEKIKISSTDTKVFIKNQFKERLDFKDDPQAQLDNQAFAIAGNIDGIAHLNGFVQDNTGNIAILSADKQNFAIEKHEGNLNVGTMQEFQDYFYELRKSPTRTYQYEVSSSTNLDLMDILGWPNGNGKSAFIYVNLPYSEAGGYEIDITYMERNGDNIYKRTMSATLNANWKDTGWTTSLEKKTEIVKLWEGNAKTIPIDATNYDFLIVTINFSNINISNSFYNLKYNKPVGVLDTTHKNDNTQYAARYFYDANSKELKLLRIGFYTDNIYTDRLPNADYSILSIYGIKGVQA